MKLFKNLLGNADSVTTLDTFISENILQILDFPNKSFNFIELEKNLINQFINEKGELVRALNFDKDDNKSFISVLFDLCERLGLINTVRISGIVLDNNIIIGHRLLAANLYLLGVTNNSDLITRFDKLCDYLQLAISTEEDNEIKANLTFANYVAFVIRNAPAHIQGRFFSKFSETLLSGKYDFLINSPFLQSLLEINRSDIEDAVIQSRQIIDEYIRISLVIPNFNPDFLIESDTEYAAILKLTELSFIKIRQISVDSYNLIKNDAIFNSLQRGIRVLTEESQLFAYMFSFGNMHYEKLNTAFNFLPEEFFDNAIEIIDWGCGQGMATITYFDYLLGKNINQSCSQISLIEPSEIALKRSSLHIEKYAKDSIIHTVNKDLDSVIDSDLKNRPEVKLHLFSNILDIELFSMSQLITFIGSNFKGQNYFVCVSPYVTDIKTSRLDNFMRSFVKFKNYHGHKSINNKVGEWKGNWTRVVRVFQVEI